MRYIIRSRFFAAACVLLAVSWAAVALVLHLLHQQTEARAVATGENLARTLAAEQESSVRAIDLSLQFLRNEWGRNRASFAQAVEQNEDYLKREHVIQVAVMNREGWIVYSRLPQPPERVNFLDRDYVQRLKASTSDVLEISAPVLGRITGQWAIQFSRALRDADGQFAGMIVVAVPPPALELALEGIDLGKDSFISLERSDGTVLARTGGARLDDVERIVNSRKLDEHPLTVRVGQSVKAVFELYRMQRNALVGAGILATGLLLALALVAGSRRRDRARYLAHQERLMLDLHDGCIQAIYAIGLQLQNSRRFIGKDPAATERAIAEAGASLNLVIQDLRAFIAGATRATYSEEEFMAEIDRMFAAGADAEPVFSLDVDRAAVSSLPPGQAEQVLRIAREAISNVVRHAKARTARVSLAKRDGHFSLQVSDDGIGLASSPAATLGLGLNHIQARAKKLGGAAKIASAPGGGTQVSVEWPQQP